LSGSAAFGGGKLAAMLDAGPLPRIADWFDWVNRPQSNAELATRRQRIDRGTPFGNESWQHATAERWGSKRVSIHGGDPAKSLKSGMFRFAPIC
jgi:hypothetical protein